MNKLLAALQMTQEEYEVIIFKKWWHWCRRHATGNAELQSLVANTSLFNWWRMEYSQFERDFLFEIAPYNGNVSKQDAMNLYTQNTYKMQMYYSKPLINNAKKTKIING